MISINKDSWCHILSPSQALFPSSLVNMSETELRLCVRSELISCLRRAAWKHAPWRDATFWGAHSQAGRWRAHAHRPRVPLLASLRLTALRFVRSLRRTRANQSLWIPAWLEELLSQHGPLSHLSPSTKYHNNSTVFLSVYLSIFPF